MSAVIDLAAWAHAHWIRIHPFANGNERETTVIVLHYRSGIPAALPMQSRACRRC